MPIENDFLVFAGQSGANVVTQSSYAGQTWQQSGFVAGIAPSAQLNKPWRQSSIMAAVLAQFIVNNSGQPAIDDGTTATLLANLQTAIIAAIPKGLGSSATYGGTPTSGTPTLFQKAYTPFVATSNGVVSAMAYANFGGGGAQPGAVQNSIQIVGSISGTFTSSDTTKLPMTNCVVAHVVAGETVTVTSFTNSDGTAAAWNSIGAGSSYTFVPTN